MSDEEQVRIAWNLDEAAGAIGITVRHLQRLIAQGHGPRPVRLGRRVVFRPETIRAWLQEKEAA